MNVKLLAKSLTSRSDELQKFVSSNFEEVYKSNKFNYERLAKLIQDHNQELDDNNIKTIITGYMISKPFGRGKYLDTLEEAISDPHINIKRAINESLRHKFENKYPLFYNQLQTIQYKEKQKEHTIKLTRNHNFVKEITEKTSSCIYDQPDQFFEQIISDPGTIYVVAKNDNPNGPVGYVRLYAYSGIETNQNILIVDTMWFTKTDKHIATKLTNALAEIGSIVGKEILDFKMPGKFIEENSERADVFITKDKYYKLGHAPYIHRFAKPVITPNDEFYCINPHK